MDQAAIAQGLHLRIGNPVIGLGVAAGGKVADVLLEVLVEHMQALRPVDDREEPAGPGQGGRIRVAEELGVELVDESFHRPVRIQAVPAAPAHQGAGGPPDLPFHLPHGRGSDVDVAAMAAESEELERLVRGIDPLLVGIDRQPVTGQEAEQVRLAGLQRPAVRGEQDDVVRVTGIDDARFREMAVHPIR